MDWPRVKTILIIFFLLINLLLTGILWSRSIQAENTKKETSQKIAEILLKSGLDVGGVVIPPVTSHTYDVDRELSLESAAAAVLLGEILSEEVSGGSLSLVCAGGSAVFKAGGAFEIIPSEPIALPEGASAADGVLRLARDAGFISEIPDASGYVQQTETAVFVYPRAKNLPIWNSYAEFSITGGNIAGISGRWHIGELVISSGQACQSAEAALLTLAADVADAGILQSVALGFISEPISPTSVRLTPVWRIEFQTSGYYVNGITSKIERI